jgi:hypothetical protein
MLDINPIGNFGPAYVQYAANIEGGVCSYQKLQPSFPSITFDLDYSSSVSTYSVTTQEEKQLRRLYQFVSSMVENSKDLEPEISIAVSKRFWDLI